MFIMYTSFWMVREISWRLIRLKTKVNPYHRSLCIPEMIEKVHRKIVTDANIIITLMLNEF